MILSALLWTMCVRLGVLIDFATPFNPYGTQWMWVWKAQLEMGVGTFRARGHGLLKQMARPYRIRRPKCFRELPNRNKCHKNDVLQNHSCQAFQLTLARDQLSILEGDLVRNLRPVTPVVLRDVEVLTGEELWDFERLEVTKMARDSKVTPKPFDVG